MQRQNRDYDDPTPQLGPTTEALINLLIGAEQLGLGTIFLLILGLTLRHLFS